MLADTILSSAPGVKIQTHAMHHYADSSENTNPMLFITHRNIRFLHMTNFSPHISLLILVTNIRYDTCGTKSKRQIRYSTLQALKDPHNNKIVQDFFGIEFR